MELGSLLTILIKKQNSIFHSPVTHITHTDKDEICKFDY